MNSENLFIETIDDIKKKLVTQSTYDFLKISGMLRLLLLDKLVDTANKKHKLKIAYIANPVNEGIEALVNLGLGVTFANEVDSLNPDLSGYKNGPKEYKKDDFLKIKPLYLHGNYYSIKDIINLIANAEGGVHFEENVSRDKNKDMSEFNRSFYVLGRPAITLLIRPITQISVKSLEPLYNLIKEEQKKTSQFHFIE